MNSASRFRRSRREHSLVDLVAVHAPAPEQRKERRVQVDHRNPRQSHEEDRREDMVEARKYDELGADARDRRGHRRMGGSAVRVGAECEDGARHAGERGTLQRGDTGMVRDDDRHARIEPA